LATIQNDTTRELAWAVKVNLYSGKDFYNQKEIFELINQDVGPIHDTLLVQIERLRKLEDTASTDASRFKIAYDVFQLEQQLAGNEMMLRERMNLLRNIYMKRFWNSTSIDVCFGRTYLYSSEDITNLRQQRSGIGIWLTGGFGIGKNWFLSGLLKNIRMSADQFSYQRGVNIRYGNLRFQFFAEWVMQNDRLRQLNIETAETELRNIFISNVGYGGSFRIGSNLLLSFGIRTLYDRNLNFKSLLPVANLSCLMR
jgi:hypothetical protein